MNPIGNTMNSGGMNRILVVSRLLFSWHDQLFDFFSIGDPLNRLTFLK